MNKRLLDTMIDLINNQLFDKEIENINLSESEVNELMELASFHGISQIIYLALRKNNLLDEKNIWQKKYYSQLVQIVQIENEENRLFHILEKNQIDHVPLKGTLMRKLYPKSIMRSSCDIDILVHKEDVQIVIEKLKDVGYTLDGNENYHDYSLYSDNGIHLELHFNIQEMNEKLDRVLSTVWDNVILKTGTKHCYLESNEYFVYHHLAHMAYHMLHGGCGIRSFIDFEIIRRNITFDENKLKQFLAISELDLFYIQINALCDYWFNDAVPNQETIRLEEYVLNGGLYGTSENKIKGDKKKESNVKYYSKKIFVPYSKLVIRYPILKKWVILYPLAIGYRIIDIVRQKGNVKRWIENDSHIQIDEEKSIFEIMGFE